jgi:hypothetical protein
MKSCKTLFSLSLFAVAVLWGGAAFAQNGCDPSDLNNTGNCAPSGPHYNLNIIGVEKNADWSPTMTGSNRHTIFVALNNQEGTSSKIYLMPAADFRVCDGNAFDAAWACGAIPGVDDPIANTGAVFELPCNTNIGGDFIDPVTGDPVETETVPCDTEEGEAPTLAYEVWARGLGKGGQATITTCATDSGSGDIVCSTENVLLVRNPGKTVFKNVTNQLTSLVVCFDTSGDGLADECIRYALFSDGFEDWYWDYFNQGLRLAQLRFYPL